MVELCQYACIHVPDSITVNHEETTVFQHSGQLETILYVYLWCASFYSTGMHISMVVVIEGGKLLEEIYIYIFTQQLLVSWSKFYQHSLDAVLQNQ